MNGKRKKKKPIVYLNSSSDSNDNQQTKWHYSKRQEYNNKMSKYVLTIMKSYHNLVFL